MSPPAADVTMARRRPPARGVATSDGVTRRTAAGADERRAGRSRDNLAIVTTMAGVRILGWRRVRFVAGAVLAISLLFLDGWHGSLVVLYGRLLFVGFAGLVVFGGFERWPAQLPPWLARWALQLVGVTLAVPLAIAIGYLATPYRNGVPFWADDDQLVGLAWMT